MLNIGCGLNKMDGWVNVDAYGTPDILWNLNKYPWPWKDNSIDEIYANHIFEHLLDWFGAFKECARILKTGGSLQINVPDHTCTLSLGYLDHLHVFSPYSFHMIMPTKNRGTNTWARQQPVIPFKMLRHERIPFPRFNKWWIPKPILRFLCSHMVNFCHEQKYTFIKTKGDSYGKEEGQGKRQELLSIQKSDRGII